jgi:RimJ/RimL family protein N-acetyltransferase
VTQYDIRPVHAHEWRRIKALRLRALSDEAAPMAFLESHAEASSRSEEFWQDRALGSAVEAGLEARARQFVAVTGDGAWVGTAVALLEKPGEVDVAGAEIIAAGGLVVGVFLCPEHRGRGVLGRLLQAVADWLRESGLDRVRLYVHADNLRAQRAYEKSGFRPTGRQISSTVGPEIEMARTL